MRRVLYCSVMLCVRTSYYVQYTNCTVPSLPIIPFTRFAFALLNFLGSQHNSSTIQSIDVQRLLFLDQVYSTTVVLPALEVCPFFVFDVLIKQQYCSAFLFYPVSFVLNFELVVIYRGLLHCCTLLYTYVLTAVLL